MFGTSSEIFIDPMGSHGGSDSKESACNMRDLGSNLVSGRSLEGRKVATHPSILGWRTPWTEKPDRLQPVGS